jgi:hypothetical protein
VVSNASPHSLEEFLFGPAIADFAHAGSFHHG